MAQAKATPPALLDETMRLNAAAIYCICFITSVLGEPEAIAIDNADNTRIVLRADTPVRFTSFHTAIEGKTLKSSL